MLLLVASLLTSTRIRIRSRSRTLPLPRTRTRSHPLPLNDRSNLNKKRCVLVASCGPLEAKEAEIAAAEVRRDEYVARFEAATSSEEQLEFARLAESVGLELAALRREVPELVAREWRDLEGEPREVDPSFWSMMGRPPVDGVNLGGVLLRRKLAVELVDRTDSEAVVVVRAAPGSGKTSLLQLAGSELAARGRRAKYFRGVIPRHDEFEEPITLVVDDAPPFREEDLASSGARWILATAGEETDLGLSDGEVDELFDLFGRTYNPEWRKWTLFRDELKALANGRVGAVMAGLFSLYDDLPKDETLASKKLGSTGFASRLGRCFPRPSTMPGAREVVRAVAAAESGSGYEGFESLRNSGILGPDGFSSPAASTFYYFKLYPERAKEAPESLRALVKLACGSLSASALGDAASRGHVLHQYFNEAFHRQLPRTYVVRAEKFVLEDGARRRPDFFVHGLRWLLEFKRCQNEEEGHRDRLATTYRHLDPTQSLVLDCRVQDPTTTTRRSAKGVRRDLCTASFAPTFSEVTLSFDDDDDTLVTIPLAP